MQNALTERFVDILRELRRERDSIEPQLTALNEAILAFERMHNGGQKRRGRPKGSSNRTAAIRDAQAS